MLLSHPLDGIILPHEQRLDHVGEVALLVHLVLNLDVGLIDVFGRSRGKGFQRCVAQGIVIGAKGDQQLLHIRMKAFHMIAEAERFRSQRGTG